MDINSLSLTTCPSICTLLVLSLLVRTRAALLGGSGASVLGGFIDGADVAEEFLARAAALAVGAVFLPVYGFPNVAIIRWYLVLPFWKPYPVLLLSSDKHLSKLSRVRSEKFLRLVSSPNRNC